MTTDAHRPTPPEEPITPDEQPSPSTRAPETDTPPAQRRPINWTAWLIVGVVVLALSIGIVFFVANVLPVWWANIIGNQVDKNLASGVLLGLFYGSVFTFFPLLLIWQIRRPKLKWPAKIALIVLAVLVAVPNLITLGIHVGSNAAAHNAQRILGTEATWFGTWTAYGALLGGLAFLALVVSVAAFRKRGQRVRQLEAEK
ncbi:hypothetical protein [Micrococcoides hystricis]|uniref:Permease n=1 Tax=Micrococcoides hystricis TaxID=1572761 RepID=A0ABV6P6N7_9MICC